MAKTTSNIILEQLLEWGIDTYFGLPGDGINGYFESMRLHRDQIRYVHCRHEEAASLAAVGHAKFTDKSAVCISTAGPDGVHMLNGMYDAKMEQAASGGKGRRSLGNESPAPWGPRGQAMMSGREEKTSESDPIRVDFLSQEETGQPGRLGMTFAPGKKSEGADGVWDRDLASDLERLAEEYRVEVFVSLMEHIEYSYLEVPDLLQKAEERGMEVIHLPIPDGSAPADPEADRYVPLVEDVAERLERGQNVVVHCRGGQGRSGMFAASVLVALGHPAVKALEIVRKTRKGAVETPEQEDRVHFLQMELGSRRGPREES